MTDATTIIEEDNEQSGSFEPSPPAETPPEAPKKQRSASKAAQVQSAPAPSKAAQVQRAPAPSKFRIILEENDDIPPTGLPLGINGKSYIVRPGEEVTVPAEVIECLNDAVMGSPVTDQNGNVLAYRNKLRYPYRLLGKA